LCITANRLKSIAPKCAKTSRDFPTNATDNPAAAKDGSFQETSNLPLEFIGLFVTVSDGNSIWSSELVVDDVACVSCV
jgi:hypothetical protein